MSGRGLVSAVAIAVLAVPTIAHADRDFAVRYSTNDTGAITMASNTVETCPASNPACAPAQDGATSASNNSFVMRLVDVDEDPATVDSSRAKLHLPAGATVLYAALYWGANTARGTNGAAARDASARATVLLDTPAGGGYTRVMADTVDRGSATSQKEAYQGFADVTALVRAAGAGVYTVADVQAGTGEDRYGGWTLVVAYRDRLAPARNLTIFDGLVTINSGDPPRQVVVDGFRTPLSGPVHSTLGLTAYEGDRSLGGDSAALNLVLLGDAANPSNNLFNSTVTVAGAAAPGRTPDYHNQLGFDTNRFDASALMRNGITSATLKFQTSGDTYMAGVVFVATDLYAPDVVLQKSVGDLNGGEVEPGDELEYAISGHNQGQDAALGIELTDVLPSATTFVPGSLEVVGSGQGELDTAAQQVVVRLGHGADTLSGGRLGPGETFTVRFRVRVRDGTPSGTAIDNSARANFVAEALGFTLEAQSNRTHLVTVAPDLAIAKSHAGTLAPGTAGAWVIAVRNVGDGPTHGDVHVHDALPSGVVASAPAGAGWSCAVVAGVVDCTRADALAPAAAYPDITIPVDVAFDAVPPLENTASVSGGGENDPANDEATDSATPEPAANLGIAKSGEPAEPRPGQAVTYVLDVANDGPALATGVVVDDPAPAGLMVHAVVTDQGTCELTVHCALGALAPGQLLHVRIQAVVAADAPAGPIANAATVTGAQRDPDPANNRATATVIVRATANVVLGKRLLGAAHAGQPVTWAITAVNHGPHRADGLVVVDPLPKAVEEPKASVVGDAGHCTISGREARCTLHTLAVGERTEIRLSGRLGVHTAGTFLENAAELFEREDDPAPRAAAHSDQVIVEPAADVETAVDATPATPRAGDQLTYHARVENLGPQADPDVRFVERLPAGLVVVSVPANCTASGDLVRCAEGTLQAAQSRSLDIVVRVLPSAARRQLRALVAVAGARPDPAGTDNHDVARTTVGRAAPHPSFTG